jgi:hypothetical protein
VATEQPHTPLARQSEPPGSPTHPPGQADVLLDPAVDEDVVEVLDEVEVELLVELDVDEVPASMVDEPEEDDALDTDDIVLFATDDANVVDVLPLPLVNVDDAREDDPDRVPPVWLLLLDVVDAAPLETPPDELAPPASGANRPSVSTLQPTITAGPATALSAMPHTQNPLR